jgi:hypothetical protein
MADGTSFYELAALLNPVLALTGFVTGRLPKPQPAEVLAGGSLRGAAVWVVFGMLPAAAEMLALSAALTGRTTTFGLILIVAAVVIGTWSFALAAVWPWFGPFWRSGTALGRAVWVIVSVGLLLATGQLIVGAVESQANAEAQEDLQRLEASVGTGGYDRTLEVIDAQERELHVLHLSGYVPRKAYLRRRRELAEMRVRTTVEKGTAEAEDRARRLQLLAKGGASNDPLP